MVQPGLRTIAQRYELFELLATGGMGQVWRGRDALLGRPVAVKVLRSEYTGDPTFRARFRNEAQHAALLVHRNIAAVFDYGEVGADEAGETLAYLVMELVDGEPLSALLARERRLGVPQTLDLLHQTASALAAAHAAGVVHRDVKPGNVLVGRDGTVRITDFGIAWSASDVPLTQTGQVVGTAHYLSPEQADGGKAGPASDVYALGMIGYECLAGRRAFDGDNAVQIALRHLTDVPAPLPADVPDPVRSLVGRALLKDPAARFADGADFRDAVSDVLAGREPPAPPVPLLPIEPGTTPLALHRRQPAGTSRRTWRRVLAPVATLAAGAVIGIGALQFLAPGDPVPPAAAGTATGGSSPAAEGIRLVAAGYLGRPVAEVEEDLEQLGLQVALVAVAAPDAAPGTVTAVDPLGPLERGDSVTVSYAASPTPAPSSGIAAQVAEEAAGQPPSVAVAPAAATTSAPNATPPTVVVPVPGSAALPSAADDGHGPGNRPARTTPTDRSKGGRGGGKD